MTLWNAGKVVVLDDSQRGSSEDIVEVLVMERLEDCLWGMCGHMELMFMWRVREIVCKVAII